MVNASVLLRPVTMTSTRWPIPTRVANFEFSTGRLTGNRTDNEDIP